MSLLHIHDEIYLGDPNEPLARYVKNAFGHRESLTMPKLHWDYMDWLISIGADMDGYIIDCDHARGEVPFGDALQSWLYYAFKSREKDGLARPSWLAPLWAYS